MRNCFIIGFCLLCFGLPLRAQETIPEALPLVDDGAYDIVNILLIGSAVENPNNPGLTDSLLMVSANRSTGHVSLVSIPRDLYVYVPGFDMQKINTAYYYGETKQVEGGGIGLLKETIRYNLGVEIDFYARVDFNSFGKLIDSVGGINITVDCIIQDWKLKEPGLNKHDPDNYELYTVLAGRHHFDGEIALWYVRSRRTSSDIDRGRRQQDVLRALWRSIRQQGLLEQLPSLWNQLNEMVDTDMGLQDVLGMLPLALNVTTSDIEYFRFRLKHEVNNAVSPAGQSILMPQREAVIALMQNVVQPPTSSQTAVQRPTLAIANASGVRYLPYVMADRLELEGFKTVILDEWQRPRRFNKIIDYTGATKGSRVSLLQRILHVTLDGVEINPDPDRLYDYKVIIGSEYQFLTCTRDVIQPQPPTTEELAQSN